MNQKNLVNQIRDICATGGEALSLTVLCDSVGSIGLPDPLIVPLDATIKECVTKFTQSSVGGVCVVNAEGKLVGIFTERDCVVRVVDAGISLETPVKEVMTKDPISESPNTTIAFALTLMSHGGFRHIPIVDDGIPIGLLSVKHVNDFLVHRMMEGIIDNLELVE